MPELSSKADIEFSISVPLQCSMDQGLRKLLESVHDGCGRLQLPRFQ